MFSKPYNTIFVHIPKTGGQSIEQVFLQMHGLTWKERSALLLGENPMGSKPRHLAHLYAREYCECGHLPQGVFDSCFKFSTVRNPYDRMFSEYRYRAHKRKTTFEEFIAAVTNARSDRHLVPQTKFLYDGMRNLIVDQIIRFENLEAEFAEISKRLFGRAVPLPHANKSIAAAAPPLTEELRRSIYKRYECDFDFFQYSSGHKYVSVVAPST